jgi:glycine oxidase
MRVLVVGAGIVGAACARALADAGARVTALDPGAGPAAASWASAGILSPGGPHRFPDAFHDLAARSLELWGGIGARHPELGLREVGMLVLGDEPELFAWREERGLPCTPAQWLGTPAMLLPEVAVLRASLAAPALLRGGAGREPVPLEGRRDAPAELDALRRDADAVVIASGAWAAPHLAAAGLPLAVAPRRGQMMRFACPAPPPVLRQGGGEEIAVPRSDGRVLVGTTLEDVGFDAATEPATLDRLEAWARRWVPGLGAREDAWAGLRPFSPRPLPTIGWAADGVIAAVGHHRNGVLLAPATGELVRDLVLGRAPRVDPAPFAP